MAPSRFQWNKGDKIENLICCLANYKSKMEWNTIDLNADKVKMYEDVREAMAQIYEGEPTFFGPPTITPLPAPDQVDKQEMADTQRRQKNEKVIKKGYTRVQEELKETPKFYNCSHYWF